LFSVMRNEMLRLPYFLEYHRKLGISSFFIISNDSTDGTTEFLLKQPDCHVFYTDCLFSRANGGIDWINSLISEYALNRWILKVDADELYVYPHCERSDIRKLCAWMDKHNYGGLYTLVLDMYSRGAIKDVVYSQGESFLSACCLFDRDYSFVKRFGLPFRVFPKLEPIGGPRTRLCFPEQNTTKVLPRLILKLLARIHQTANKYGFLTDNNFPVVAPLNFTIRLIKAKNGRKFINSHCPTRLRLAPATGALLHFKYFQDFYARVSEAIARRSHFRGSIEYIRYAKIIFDNPDLSLEYENSQEYMDSNQLVNLGLIKDDLSWSAFSIQQHLTFSPNPGQFTGRTSHST